MREAQTVKPANQRGAARLAAVQALYQMEISGQPLNEVVAEYEAFRLGRIVDEDEYLPADPAYFRKLVAGVLKEQRRLDQAIDRVLAKGWPLERLDALLRALLRVGAYELYSEKHVPSAVVMNEFLDIAAAFYDAEERRLVNGVLNTLGREFRADEAGPDTGTSSAEN